MNINTLARRLAAVRQDARVTNFQFFFDAEAGQQEVAVGRIWQTEITHDGVVFNVVGSLKAADGTGYPVAKPTVACNFDGTALPTAQAALSLILQEIAQVHIDSYVDWALDGAVDEEARRE